MTPLEWIVSNDTGISSKAIWSVMMGVEDSRRRDTPSDPADFGRCYRLLQHFPEWRERLHEVAERYPKWGPLVEAWDELTALYEEEIPNHTGRAPKLYARMKELEHACMLADGWVRTGPSSYSRGDSWSHSFGGGSITMGGR